jgi:glycosyltransferase involved in cell wall biosynthesis
VANTVGLDARVPTDRQRPVAPDSSPATGRDSSPQLSIIVPVRDDAARLDRCLSSIRRSAAGTPIELVVGDNGSTDASAEIGRRHGARVVDLPGRSVASLRNDAAAEAQGPVLAFIDADHEICSAWVAEALRIFEDRQVAAAGAQYHGPGDGTWAQRAYDLLRRHETGVEPALWLPSGNLLVRRETFAELGGFDTGLETCEDVDLCRRIRDSGRKILASPRLGSIHHGDPHTVRTLFRGELWRGRDSLRVSLRGRWSRATAVGIVLPLASLVALGLMVAGAATRSGLGIGAGLALLAAPVVLRSAVMYRRAPESARGPILAIQVLVVSGVYEVARALAPLARAGHRVRRRE